jgi:hypothetical protein
MTLFSYLRQSVFWKWVLFTFAPCGVVLVVLVAVQAVGRWTRTGLRGNERFQVAFADIECTPPPALSPGDFLGEVQYLSGSPERIDLMARELAQVLTTAFSRHPWVEGVDRIEVLPGRKLRVQLVYRTPVLAVKYAGQYRAIDGQGVLLPATAPLQDLPIYCCPVPPPRGSPGMEWGDPDLMSAARTLAYLQGQLGTKQFKQVESTVTGIVLTTPDHTRILWGLPVDGDSIHLAGAQKKRAYLSDHCKKHGSLDEPDGPCLHDLRPLDRPSVTPSGTAPSPRD